MERESRIGCLPAALVVLLLLWLVGLPIAVRAALPLPVAVFRGVPLRVLAAGLGLIPAFFLIARVTRGRLGWHTVAAVATALLALAGFLFLDAAMGTFPFGSPLVASASRLCVLTLYSVLAAWWAPRLAGLGRPPVAAALGLNRLRLAPLALSVALAALITLPWPLTGALGDRLTSLQLLFQALARVLPDLLVVWGVGFFLLNGTLARGWVAGLLTILAYWLFFAASQVLCLTSTSVLPDIAVFVPLPLLLTELRARHAGLYPLIPLTWAAYAAPLLFMDPRDVLAQGMPQPAHLLSYAIAFVLALLLGLFLWAGRQLALRAQRRDQAPLVQPRLSLCVAIGVAIVALLAWGILYTAYGAPGFHDDGFLIILRSQADLSQAATMGDRQARKEFVYRRLVETAEATQGPLRAELDAMGLSYRPYYIVNMIRVDGHRWLMGRFQGRSDVAQVIANPNVRPYPVCWSLTSLLITQNIQKPSAVQSNLQAIGAPSAWALGVTGQGIVVAGEDTGFDWTHPALRDHYRGWDGQAAQHDYNWHDAWDDTAVPFDDDVHGTHTMGTIVGDDGSGDRPGIAPGAKWVGCRNMRRGFGNPGAYAECMEFLLAPYPHGGDPFHDGDVAKAPDVVNNSWGCPPFEGCSADTLRSAAESLRAAGIMMVVSAGNEGPNCSTVQDPPANYAAVFSVGATDESGQVIASFSSRGPGEDGVKPDISAPGEGIRSSVPGGGYALLDGTSMAGPHVVGAVALVWSANPALIGQIDATERLLCQTATPKPVERICTPADVPPEDVFAQIYFNPICACGEAVGVPNNVYGCGVVDAAAAVREALAGSHR